MLNNFATILQQAFISKTIKTICLNYNMIDNMNPDNFFGLVFDCYRFFLWKTFLSMGRAWTRVLLIAVFLKETF